MIITSRKESYKAILYSMDSLSVLKLYQILKKKAN